MVMLVGVQSNQFPRALDLARPLRERGIQVALGGFHASGTLSMLRGVDPDLDKARAMGSSIFARGAEGRLSRRGRGIPLALGGFHASGTLSMLRGVDPDLDKARAMGISIFAGEAEGRLDEVLRDAQAGAPKRLSTFMNDLPETGRA